MPAGLAMALIFPLAGHLSDRLPAPAIISAGTLLIALSCYALSVADVNTLPWVMVLWVAVGRIGLGLGLPSISTGSLRVLPLQLVSQGAGAVNFSRQLGGAIGVNLLSLALDRRTAQHASSLTDTQTAGNTVTTELLRRWQELGPTIGLSPDQLVPESLRFLGKIIHAQAYAQSFRDSFLMLAFVFVIALIPAWIMRRSMR